MKPGAGDLVAGADPEDDEREVERRGAARERDGVLDACHRGELRLERVDLRPERRDPVRRDRLGHELALAAGEVGRGEEMRATAGASLMRRRGVRAHHAVVPAAPLKGPTTSLVIHPP